MNKGSFALWVREHFGNSKKPERERTPEELVALKAEIALNNEAVQKTIDQLNAIFAGKLVKLSRTGGNGYPYTIDVCKSITPAVYDPFDQLSLRYVYIDFANNCQETFALRSFTDVSMIEDDDRTQLGMRGMVGGGFALALFTPIRNDAVRKELQALRQVLNKYFSAAEALAGKASNEDTLLLISEVEHMGELKKKILGIS